MIKVTKSPLKTHAFDPSNLPVPALQHDLVEWIPCDGSDGFETIAAARAEDRKRSRLLQRSNDPEAQELGRWLEVATTARLLPLSPASVFYMRTCRRKLLGGVMAHVYGKGLHDHEVMAVTLIHPAWFYRAGDLDKADPKAIRKQLQRWFDRAGITKADGIFWAGLHGEFNGTGYQLHFHGIATGAKADLIRKLYGHFGFLRIADILQQPVVITDAYDLAGWLSYCLKYFWPEALKYSDKNGNTKKGKKHRLQPLQHEEFLMWMAKHNLMSMIIHSGFAKAAVGNLGKATV